MKRIGFGAVSAAVVAFVPGAAWAQTASQITPQSYAPPVQMPSPGPVVIAPDQGSSAPTGAEGLVVQLSAVDLAGGSDADRAMLASRLVGRPVTLADVYASAHALELAYARSGHVLTRVIVPAQRLEPGATLHLELVEGYVEAVDTSHVPGPVRRRVARLLASLVGARGLTERELERRLLLAADTPGIRLRSTLAAGSKPGATVLVIEAGYRPVTGFVSVDNTLPDALGRDVIGLGVNLNSILGAGETIYARVSGLPTGGSTGFFTSTPRDRSLAAGFIVPVGDNGLTFNLEGTDAQTAARHPAGQPGFDSRFERLSARLQYPFVRTRALTVTGEASFDAQDERVRVIDPLVVPVSLDRMRIVRFAGEATSYLPSGGVADLRAELSFGLDGLGARNAAEATPTLPLSRQGADAEYQKLLASLSLDQPLAPHLAVAVRARAQTSFGQPLVNAEQIGIASVDAISPLPSGTLQGDSGVVGRGEVRAPFDLGLRGPLASLAPYAFGAVGSVSFEEPTAVERYTTNAEAWGAGIRFSGSGRSGLPGLSASLEYGVARVDGVPGHPKRLSFTVITLF